MYYTLSTRIKFSEDDAVTSKHVTELTLHKMIYRVFHDFRA